MVLVLIPQSGFSQVKKIFVSPHGNDKNPGTKELPCRSLEYVQSVVRGLDKRTPIQIILQEGTYYLSQTLVFEQKDSGTKECPIVWKAEKNKQVVISGGRPVKGKWLINDGDAWVTEIPEARERNWIFRQLFVDGRRMTRARYPNKSEVNPFLYAKAGGKDVIEINKKRIQKSWGNATDAQINIVPGWKFFNQWNSVKNVNVRKGEIYLHDSELHAEVTKGNWFWIEGVKEELDEPEEWFLDEINGKLFYMPGKGINPNIQVIIAPRLDRLIYLKGDVENQTHVSHIEFRNIEFKHTTFNLGHIEPRVHTDAAIVFENALNCIIENCHFENIGGYALWMHLDSKYNSFNNNMVTESGGGGVLLTGARFSYMDDSKLFTPGKEAAKVFPILNAITNNVVSNCGRIRYYGGGVHLDSRPGNMAMEPGNYIAHNHFNNLSRNGIFAFRNQGGNVVEYNHINDVMQTTIDGACIHFATMTHQNAPNYILNNYLHDIWGYEQKANGKPVRHLANGVFLDWATSNTTVKYNYIYNSGGEAIKTIMGNKDLIIENNVISASKIEPPFMKDTGPGSLATNGINILDTQLTGNVIHYSNQELVSYKGDWQPKEIIGFWNLFSYSILEVEMGESGEITYSLPVIEEGMYKLSLLYVPGEENATNVEVTVHHADGKSQLHWNMQEGDKFGFSVPIGKYRFSRVGDSRVVISNRDANGRVVANSVAFVKD
jgi:hypothetical protein